MIQIDEERLAELIRKADKFEWLTYIGVEDILDEKDISLMDSTGGDYYKYDDMPDKEVVEDYL